MIHSSLLNGVWYVGGPALPGIGWVEILQVTNERQAIIARIPIL